MARSKGAGSICITEKNNCSAMIVVLSRLNKRYGYLDNCLERETIT